MRRVTRATVAFGIGLANIGGVGGCTAKMACTADRPAESATSVELSESVVFSEAKERRLRNFVARLRGLPELWPGASAISSADLVLKLTMQYTDSPGQAGKVQMPRLRIGLVGDDKTVTDTPSVPPSEWSYSYGIFQECFGDEPRCCPFGSRECESRFTLSFERTEGVPFPPVLLEWALSAKASIDDCPLGKSEPELTLESAEP